MPKGRGIPSPEWERGRGEGRTLPDETNELRLNGCYRDPQ